MVRIATKAWVQSKATLLPTQPRSQGLASLSTSMAAWLAVHDRLTNTKICGRDTIVTCFTPFPRRVPACVAPRTWFVGGPPNNNIFFHRLTDEWIPASSLPIIQNNPLAYLRRHGFPPSRVPIHFVRSRWRLKHRLWGPLLCNPRASFATPDPSRALLSHGQLWDLSFHYCPIELRLRSHPLRYPVHIWLVWYPPSQTWGSDCELYKSHPKKIWIKTKKRR